MARLLRPDRRPLFLFTALLVAMSGNAGAEVPGATPVRETTSELGETFAREIENRILTAIDEGKLPGAVVLIGRSDRVLHRATYGWKQVEPERVAMTPETVFDMASLTKPVATATSILLLAEQGRLQFDDPVCKHWPEFAANGKEQVTVSHLLTHTSGLIADNALADYQAGREEAERRIGDLTLVSPPGERFVYSDVGFLALGFLVERLSGATLDQFVREEILHPLGMQESGYLPNEELKLRSAPANQRDGMWIQGEVHDPRAFAMGGVAGHAGLFSTADDLLRYAQMILGQGEGNGVRVLQPESVAAMLVSRSVPGGGVRTYGWDRQTGYSKNRGEGMSDQAIGHGGFTGTGMWIDPGLDLFVIVLSNRLHPDGKGAVNPLIGEIGTIAVNALRAEAQE